MPRLSHSQPFNYKRAHFCKVLVCPVKLPRDTATCGRKSNHFFYIFQNRKFQCESHHKPWYVLRFQIISYVWLLPISTLCTIYPDNLKNQYLLPSPPTLLPITFARHIIILVDASSSLRIPTWREDEKPVNLSISFFPPSIMKYSK